MKFTASSSELLKKLDMAIGAVGPKALTPLLEDFHFTLIGNTLTIKCTDFETSIITTASVEGEEDGAAAVPAKILVDMLRSLPDQPVVMELEENKQSMVVISQTGKYKVASHDPEEYPTLPEVDQENKIAIKGGILKSAITKTSFATSSDELRLAMTGVYFGLEPGEINFVATDAHKLVKYNYTTEHKNEDNFIVPKKSLSMLKSVLPDEEDVTMSFNKFHVFFQYDDTIIGSRLIDAKFPNYSQVIPDNNPVHITVDRMLFLNAMKRIMIFSNKSTHQTVLHINQNAIVIEAKDMDYSNEAKETIGCDYDGDPIDIGFNAKFIVEMLGVIESDDVILNLSTPNRAGLLLPSDQEENVNLLMLVMPVILNR